MWDEIHCTSTDLDLCIVYTMQNTMNKINDPSDFCKSSIEFLLYNNSAKLTKIEGAMSNWSVSALPYT